MRYAIIIKKLEKNEDYERQLKDWEERNRYHNTHMEDCPRRENEVPALETVLTEEEFNKIKKAVLEVM